MKILAAARVMAALPNKPNRPNEPHWIKKAEQKERGKSRNRADQLPEGTFTKSPGTIARELKQKSRDGTQAVQKLNFYQNRSGSNLDRNDQKKMEQTKEALYRMEGKEPPQKR